MKTFWYRWLLVSFDLFILMGLAFAFFSQGALFAPLMEPINHTLWGSGGLPAEATDYARFVFGIIGALTVAVAMMGYMLVKHAVSKGEMWAWNTIAMAILTWYIIDTGISAYLSLWVNVAANTLYAALVVVPLVGIRRHLGFDLANRAGQPTQGNPSSVAP